MFWRIRNERINLSDEPLIMGILNVTPDSFSDGGRFNSIDSAIRRAEYLLRQGARIIDIGGESTRPNAEVVSPAEELRRVVPIIKKLRAISDCYISIDTSKSAVAEEALTAGADIVNDISAFSLDEKMLPLVAGCECACVLMHMQGVPQNMQKNPTYDRVAVDICNYLSERVSLAKKSGVPLEKIAIDPGIGFGKTPQDNLTILKSLRNFTEIGCAVLLGLSRKSFIGKFWGIEKPSDRDFVSATLNAVCYKSGARIFRVHEPKLTLDAIKAMKLVPY